MNEPAPFLAVDLGKTHCRVVVGHDRDARAFTVELVGPGTVGFGEIGGASAALDAVKTALVGCTRSSAHAADACIAGAGFSPGPWAADAAHAFIETFSLQSCALTSDAIAAHVGAFAGGPGAVLAAGTGSVAVAMDPAGRIRVVDGVGQWLGDDGSGAWIGLEGLRAALRSRDGRGPRTSLEDRAMDAFGDLSHLPRTISGTGNVPQAVATFARAVCEAARTDPIAHEIMARAAQALANTAITAAHHAQASGVCLVGGLQELGPALLRPWRAHVEEADLEVLVPRGTALDGAARLAVDRSLPHEQAVTRIESSGPVPLQP